MKERQRRKKVCREREEKIKKEQETEAGADVTSTELYDPSVTHFKLR